MNGWWLTMALLSQVPATQAAAPTTEKAIVFHGTLSTLAAGFPKQHDTQEMRTRATFEMTADPRSWLRLRFEGLAELLVANRGGRVNDGIASVRDAWAELRFNDVEVRVGYGRVVWGRLDEVMPSDVINPIDTSRFFLDGRSDARLPVAFVRSRMFLPSETTIETVVALPGNRGRFDSLDERSSPFNLLKDVVLPAGIPRAPGIRREEPPTAWDTMQGGVRLSTTAGRVDMSVSAWRGFESFGLIGFESRVVPSEGSPIPMVVGALVERYPRITMIAGDAEMVRGGWAIRGEVAGFVDKTLAGPMGPAKGKAIDAGIGVDRAAGDYHLFGSLVWHRDWLSEPLSLVHSNLNVIASVDRRFARDRYQARVFGVVNPDDRSGFVRGLFSWNVRDNVMLETSGGAFLGQGTDTISRFTDRDFVFLRVRYSY